MSMSTLPPAGGVPPALPPPLATFLERAMAKDADQRYQTGEEFAAALRAAFGGGATPAGGAAPAGPAVDLDLGI